MSGFDNNNTSSHTSRDAARDVRDSAQTQHTSSGLNTHNTTGRDAARDVRDSAQTQHSSSGLNTGRDAGFDQSRVGHGQQHHHTGGLTGHFEEGGRAIDESTKTGNFEGHNLNIHKEPTTFSSGTTSTFSGSTTGTGISSGGNSQEYGVERGQNRGLESQDLGRNTGSSGVTGSHTGTGIGSGVGSGVGHHQGSTGQGTRSELESEAKHGHGLTSDNSKYGSNSAAQDYKSHTAGGVGSAHVGDSSSSRHGLTDKSAAHGADRGNAGNEGFDGVGRTGGSDIRGGAANTDKFDVDRASSGAGTTYGHSAENKVQTNQGIDRHGGDFTGGTAGQGAYSNEHAKTGLTGRETTTTGVNDQHGKGTEHSGGGLMAKAMNAVKGNSHKHDETK